MFLIELYLGKHFKFFVCNIFIKKIHFSLKNRISDTYLTRLLLRLKGGGEGVWTFGPFIVPPPLYWPSSRIEDNLITCFRFLSPCFVLLTKPLIIENLTRNRKQPCSQLQRRGLNRKFEDQAQQGRSVSFAPPPHPPGGILPL